MTDLAGLATGTAVICSAHPSIRLFEKCQMRMPRTFDSSATPEIGGKRTIAPKRLATPDLKMIEARMAETIRRTEEEDPRKLKQLVATLRRELAQKEHTKPVVKTERVEVPVINPKDLERIERAALHILEVGNGLMQAVRTVRAPVPAAPRLPTTIHHASPKPAVASIEQTGELRRERSLSSGERKILIALAQYPAGKSKRQVAVLTGYASGGGAFNNYLSALRTKGCITGSDGLRITTVGLELLGDFQPLPTGKALQEHWLQELSQAERCILQVLLENFPTGLGKEEIAAQTGRFKSDGVPYAPAGGGFNNAISRLRTLELIEGHNGSAIRASDTLFDA